MNSLINEQIAAGRREELLCEAEAARLIATPRRARGGFRHRLGKVLLRLESLLLGDLDSVDPALSRPQRR